MKRRFVFSLGLLFCLLFSAQAFAIEYGNPKAGSQKFQGKGCANCHGEGGRSATAAFPTLAGQYADYLVYALKAYKEGGRDNAIMKGQASGLSEADMYDISAYLSKQRSSLTVLPGMGE